MSDLPLLEKEVQRPENLVFFVYNLKWKLNGNACFTRLTAARSSARLKELGPIFIKCANSYHENPPNRKFNCFFVSEG